MKSEEEIYTALGYYFAAAVGETKDLQQREKYAVTVRALQWALGISNPDTGVMTNFVKGSEESLKESMSLAEYNDIMATLKIEAIRG